MAGYGREWDRQPGRGGYDRAYRGGYDRDFGEQRSGRGSRGDEVRVRRRYDQFTTPSRDLTGGYTGYSSRGPYGGYRGAWDLAPMTAGYDPDYRRSRRRESDRGR